MRQITALPLHGGRAPRWLFGRMVKLSGAISEAIVDEFGEDELLKRLCDTNWFQALSCAIGYDWHSSGTTTVTMGALKQSLNDMQLGIFIAGGKGKAGVNTPNDIVKGTDLLSMPSSSQKFVELSRLSAKIDSTMVYNDIGIYHHSFIFTKGGRWGVVQQAMQDSTGMAIRFQWHSDSVDSNDISNEPHTGIDTQVRQSALDLTSSDNRWVKPASIDVLPEIRHIDITSYPKRHGIYPRLDLTKKGVDMLMAASDINPKDYKEFLLTKGVGRSTIRSLAIIASLIYDKELTSRDPVIYAYNLGGKDGIPYTINRKTYDSVTSEMQHIVDRTNISKEEKYRILRSLNSAVAPSNNWPRQV